MTDPKISFRLAKDTINDARTVFIWRNDPQTLAMSFHSEAKVWQHFLREYQQEYFLPENPCPVFAEAGNTPLGFFRFEAVPALPRYPGKTIMVSINIAPDRRNNGLGSLTLKILNRYLKHHKVADHLVAEIKVDNHASQRAFEKAGYKQYDQTQKYLGDIQQTYTIYRYIKSLYADENS